MVYRDWRCMMAAGSSLTKRVGEHSAGEHLSLTRRAGVHMARGLTTWGGRHPVYLTWVGWTASTSMARVAFPGCAQAPPAIRACDKFRTLP